jgi:hypothetical protein
MATATHRDRDAEAAVVLGGLGLLAVPVIPCVFAIVMGVRSRRRIAADAELTGTRWATTGIVLGVLGLVGAAVAVLYVALF